jgi:hypothetical protein
MASAEFVSLVQLRQGLSILLDEIERQYGPTVDLDADYYWSITPGDAFRFETGGAPEPTVGQLTDDIASLREMLVSDTDRPVVIWHDLAHVIGLLTRLAALDQGTADQVEVTP